MILTFLSFFFFFLSLLVTGRVTWGESDGNPGEKKGGREAGKEREGGGIFEVAEEVAEGGEK